MRRAVQGFVEHRLADRPENLIARDNDAIRRQADLTLGFGDGLLELRGRCGRDLGDVGSILRLAASPLRRARASEQFS